MIEQAQLEVEHNHLATTEDNHPELEEEHTHLVQKVAHIHRVLEVEHIHQALEEEALVLASEVLEDSYLHNSEDNPVALLNFDYYIKAP